MSMGKIIVAFLWGVFLGSLVFGAFGCAGDALADDVTAASDETSGWCSPTLPVEQCNPVPNCPPIWASSVCVMPDGAPALDEQGLVVMRCLTTPDGLRPRVGQQAFGVECVARGVLGDLSRCMPSCPPGSSLP